MTLEEFAFRALALHKLSGKSKLGGLDSNRPDSHLTSVKTLYEYWAGHGPLKQRRLLESWLEAVKLVGEEPTDD